MDGICKQIVSAGFDRVIGTSGTILSLGAVAMAVVRGTVPTELRNLRLPAKWIRRLRRGVVDMTDKQRLALPGLDPRRADLTVAGAVLLDTILQRLGAEELTLCDLALREGLVLDYIRRHQKEIVHIEQIPDVRRRSVLELAERCHYYADHARHIVHLSLALFDQTRAIHGLGDREREWLEYAALMHDIGSHISFGRHHRHSYYLITNGDLRGFQPDEIEIIALVARYHRRSTPQDRSHEEYARAAVGPPAHGPHAGGHAARGRKPRPQPLPGDLGRSRCAPGRSRPASSWSPTAMPSSRCGPPGGTSPRSKPVVGQPVQLVMTPAPAPQARDARHPLHRARRRRDETAGARTPGPPPLCAEQQHAHAPLGIRAEHGLVYMKFTKRKPV